jgi:hypothetical protein
VISAGEDGFGHRGPGPGFPGKKSQNGFGGADIPGQDHLFSLPEVFLTQLFKKYPSTRTESINMMFS